MGHMGVDWPSMTMMFTKGDHKVTSKGNPSLTKAEVSLKMLTKTWEQNDQGFLIEFQNLLMEESEELEGSEKKGVAPVLDGDVRELVDEYKEIFLIPTNFLPSGMSTIELHRRKV